MDSDVRAEYFPHVAFIQKSIAIGLSDYPNVTGYELFILEGFPEGRLILRGYPRNLEDHRTDYSVYYEE